VWREGVAGSADVRAQELNAEGAEERGEECGERNAPCGQLKFDSRILKAFDSALLRDLRVHLSLSAIDLRGASMHREHGGGGDRTLEEVSGPGRVPCSL
jgi:hypothetical protein